MSGARFKVTFAGPMVTIQDGGRMGSMRYGVTEAGPMDRRSFQIANTALGNASDATGFEVSLGGLILECISGEASLAIAGGGFSVLKDSYSQSSWAVLTLREGEKLTLRGGDWGSWAYLAFAGKMQANKWLGSSATHFLSGFGGGRIETGQEFEVLDAVALPDRVGDLPCPDFAKPRETVRCVIGPQDEQFPPKTLSAFQSNSYQLTDAYDRMGVRLSGPILDLKAALSIPSEPILRGSVQVSGDGVPTLLIADHQTTGGYPKIATVLSCDIDRLTQARSGDVIRFEPVSAQDAVELARSEHAEFQTYLDYLAKPRASLAQKLAGENLISGAVWD